MPMIRILWDELIRERLETAKDMDRDIRLILMALQDIDGRIDDLEKQHSDIEKNLSTLASPTFATQKETNRNFTETKKSPKSYAKDKCKCGKTKTKEATTCYDCYLKSLKRKTS